MPRETLRSFFTGGVSVIVGTVDAGGAPACCRGIAIATTDDFETVTVYVPVATAQATVDNAGATRRVAVGCSHPLSHESIQIKGIARDIRPAEADAEVFVRRRLEEFAAVLEQIGLPPHVTMSVAHWPAFAIDVSVEEVFDQTPGPRAGVPIG